MSRESRRHNRQKKNNRLKKTVISLGITVVVIAVLIGIFQFASPLKAFMKPGRVENLEAKVRYADVTLKWDKSKRAKAYEIKEMTGDGEYESIGFVEDNTEYSIKDYEKDVKHEYCVTPYSEDPFNGKRYEGKTSDPVEAYYDSSKYAQKIPVLAYHAIISDGENPNSLAIRESDFDEQMKWLKDNGYKTLLLDEFSAWHAGKKELPVKSVLITFDDGEYGVYHFGLPILKKYDQAATSFIIGHHDDPKTPEFDPNAKDSNYIGTDTIKEVRAEYPKLEFESHTYNMHKRIDGKMPVKVFTYDQMMQDIKSNEKYGFRYLAYPWGAYNETIQKALKDSGYKMAFAYRPFYYATRDNDTYAIDRIKVGGNKQLSWFIKTVSGEREAYDRKDEQ